MSVYLRQIVFMDTSVDLAYVKYSGVMWECNLCSQDIPMEDAYISDEGALCKTCRDQLYAKCDCGSCFQCLMQHDHTHDWKTYDSGWTKYEYCDCGVKRGVS